MATIARPEHAGLLAFVDTPRCHTWTDTLATIGSGTGISGTHAALLGLARALARLPKWTVHLAGSVRHDVYSVKGLVQAPTATIVGGFKAVQAVADLTVTSTLFEAFDKVPTNMLVVRMDSQTISREDRLQSFVEVQRQRNSRFRLVIAHLSSWSLKVFERVHPEEHWLRHPRNHHWIRHTKEISNSVHRLFFQDWGVERNEHAMIFPACLERGGSVAARVFAELKTRWGADAWALWSAYTPSGTPGEQQAILRFAGQNDSRVRFAEAHGQSKRELARAMQSAGWFVYGLSSHDNIIHLDTFGTVVAEALASGLLVLAPPVAALADVFDGLVTFVQPEGGLKAATLAAIKPPFDRTLNGKGMVTAYVRTIKQLMANGTRRAELRARGQEAAKQLFAEDVVNGRAVDFILGLVREQNERPPSYNAILHS